MILWTIQSIDAWKILQESGTLCCDRRLSDYDFTEAYKWMAEQMHKRLPFQQNVGAFPLWAWYQWGGERRERPDLRSTGHLSHGEEGVRIEFVLTDDLVLLSDFELWHYVLNYWYLPVSVADGEVFEVELAQRGLSFYETKPLTDVLYHNRIQKSWERIFDIDWVEKDLTAPKSEKSIQATFWELPMDSVRRVDKFIAK